MTAADHPRESEPPCHNSRMLAAPLLCAALSSMAPSATPPVWPAAAAITGDLNLTVVATTGGNSAVVVALGLLEISTLGTAALPGKSMLYQKQTQTSEVLGTTVSEQWTLCPRHATFRNTSILNGTCLTLAQPCFHRQDPLSLAIAQCKGGWVEKQPGHWLGSGCVPLYLPGVKYIGSFEVYFSKTSNFLEPSQWTSRLEMLETVNGGVMNTTTIERVTLSGGCLGRGCPGGVPAPVVFDEHCLPTSTS